jgi:hypothetical protein
VTATIIAPLVASHQTQPSHCPTRSGLDEARCPNPSTATGGIIEDIERDARDTDLPELDETDTAFLDVVQMLAAPLVPVAGPACCGGLMTETGPGCWRCQVCGLTLTPFHLTATTGSPTNQYSCCGRPMEQRGSRWECVVCSGWTEDFPTGSTLPTPISQPRPRRQHRSQADEGLRRIRTPRATAGTGTLNTLAVLAAPLAASTAGTYQCKGCKGWFYSEKPIHLCSGRR